MESDGVQNGVSLHQVHQNKKNLAHVWCMLSSQSGLPFNLQGTLQLHSGHEEEKEELIHKVKQLRETVHFYNDKAEELFCKCIKYKEYQDPRITALQQRHCTFHCPTLLATTVEVHPCPKQDHYLCLGCSKA